MRDKLAGRRPERDVTGSAEDRPEQDVKGSAADRPEQDVKESAEDRPEQDVKESAADMPEQNAEGSAADMPEQNAEGPAADMPGRDATGSAGGRPGRNIRKRGKILLLLAAAAAAACIVAGLCVRFASGRREHYELSPELRLTFSNADEIIPEIRKALTRHDYRIYLQYHADDGYMDDVLPLVDELMKYAMEETDDPVQGDYIRYQTGGYDIDWGHEEGESDWTYTLAITPVYYTRPAQEEAVDRDISRILSSMHFMPWTSDYEKVRAIHDYICDNVEYDAIHQSSLYHLKSTAYAALERGNAACQGYSVLFYRLVRECGISCRVVTGTGEYEGKKEFHAWNIVELGGRYYNVDTTWDSRLESDEFFLRGESGFTGHTRDAGFMTGEFRTAYPMADGDYSPD